MNTNTVSSAATVIALRNVSKSYETSSETIHALRDINLEIQQGAFVSIVGPSGSGKSTLLHIIGAMDTASDGDVLIEDKNLAHLDDNELSAFRSEHVGFIFQFFNLLPAISALENVALPQLISGKDWAEASTRAEELLELVGLGERLTHLPQALSGGEMQRVAIARALAQRPKLLVGDEPTGNLDQKTGAAVLDVLERVAQEQGVTLVLATHAAEVAERSGQRISMKDGQIQSISE